MKKWWIVIAVAAIALIGCGLLCKKFRSGCCGGKGENAEESFTPV